MHVQEGRDLKILVCVWKQSRAEQSRTGAKTKEEMNATRKGVQVSVLLSNHSDDRD